jgi:hypothetical protein
MPQPLSLRFSESIEDRNGILPFLREIPLRGVLKGLEDDFYGSWYKETYFEMKALVVPLMGF